MHDNLYNFDSSPNSQKVLNLLNSLCDSDILIGNNTTNHNLSESNTNACTSPNLVSEFTNKELKNLLGNQKDNSKNLGRKRKNDET